MLRINCESKGHLMIGDFRCDICGFELTGVELPVNSHPCKSRGLGDTIAKVTHATGIAQLVKKASGGKDCGCRKRQEQLNNLLPYKGNDNGQ